MNRRSTDPIILDSVPCRIGIDDVLKRVHVGDDSSAVEAMVREAQGLGRPKVLYREVYVDSKADDSVVIDGVPFTSRVLRVNLDEAHRVFPFVVTCGIELDEWSAGYTDLLERFWADAIKEAALGLACSALGEHLNRTFQPGKTSTMNPGSLEDWPIEQQGQLFALLGDPAGAIGVRLTDSFLMLPTKSLSGIYFPTEVAFENCQLCPREKCPGRRAKYDEDLYRQRYAGDG